MTTAIYAFIEEQADHELSWSVTELCRVLGVSRSGFYAWSSRLRRFTDSPAAVGSNVLRQPETGDTDHEEVRVARQPAFGREPQPERTSGHWSPVGDGDFEGRPPRPDAMPGWSCAVPTGAPARSAAVEADEILAAAGWETTAIPNNRAVPANALVLRPRSGRLTEEAVLRLHVVLAIQLESANVVLDLRAVPTFDHHAIEALACLNHWLRRNRSGCLMARVARALHVIALEETCDMLIG